MMAFFLSHYEKIILASMLVVFALLLIWQVNFLQAVQSQRVDAIINKEEPPSDQKKVDFEQPEFLDKTIFLQNVKWNLTENTEDTPASRIFAPYHFAICPFCADLIPSSCFPEKGAADKKCPICGNILKPRQKKIEHKDVKFDITAGGKENDRNNNDIPDDWERENNVYSELSSAIDDDPDGDRYSTYQEYVLKTNPSDPKSHPLYIAYTTVKKLGRTRINDFCFRGLASIGTADKEKMEFNIEHKENGWRSSRTRPKKFGPNGKFKHGPWTFEIIDVVPDDPASPGQGTVIYVRRDGFNEKIKCDPNKPVYDPVETVYLWCAPIRKTITCQVGKKFRLGDPKTGIEEYQVESATPDSAILVNAKGEKIKLEKSLKEPLPKRAQEQDSDSSAMNAEEGRSYNEFQPIGGQRPERRGKKNSRRR